MSEEPLSLDRIQQALINLSRGDSYPLTSCLQSVEVPSNGSLGKIECHVLKVSQDGTPRLPELIDIILLRVIDYAIPRRKIETAKRELAKTGSTAEFAKLSNEAKSLFTTLKNTGEGGELLLFVLAEYYLRYPQVFPKMQLKTDSNMHIHGADGVFLGVREGMLSLFWGESKVYKTFSSAVSDCMKSISGILSYCEESKRDITLIQDNIDFNDPELEQAILNYLDIESELYDSLETCGICLVAFDYHAFENEGKPQSNSEILEKVKEKVQGWVDTATSKINDNKLENKYLHIFLVPINSAEEFRKILLDSL